MKHIFPLFFICIAATAQTTNLLSGNIIGTTDSYDYSTNACSKTVNTIQNVFDGNYDTYFSACVRTGAWVGLDFGTSHIITQVAYSPRKTQASRLVGGIIEGANKADFSDAQRILSIMVAPPEGCMTSSDISCTKGFRYVRYIGPADKRCNISELQFFGYEGEGEECNTTQQQLTNLPTIYIETENHTDITSKEIYIPGTVTIVSNNGEDIFTDSLDIRGRGNASWNLFPKKPYRMKLRHKTQLLGAPAKAKNWTLINNYGDKTLMRNMIAFEISRRLKMPYTSICIPVDVVLNGEYKGNYQLCDQIEVNKNRVDIEEMLTTDSIFPNVSGGYLIEVDAYADQETSKFYSAYYNTPVTIKSPKDDKIVSAQHDYIKAHYNLLEKTLYSSSYTDKNTGYRKYLDLETFLKHFIVGELSGNTDTYWSVYLYKHRNNDLLYVGPVWDFDLAFDNDSRTYPIRNKTNYIYRSGGSAANGMQNFVNRILSDTDATQQLSEIWSEARYNGNITIESLHAYIDSLALVLDQSQKLNFTRWNIMNQWVHMNPAIHGSYAAEVTNVKRYISDRIPWLDKKIGLKEPAALNHVQELQGYVSTANGKIYLHNFEQQTQIRIYSIGGQLLSTTIIETEEETILLPNGIYLVQAHNKKGAKVFKICI